MLTVGPVLVLHIELAKSEVAQGDVTGVIKQDILRLQIPVNDVEAMQTLQCTEKLCCVET